MTYDFSVLVLTKNEEHDLPGCLQSIARSDDVVVFDSFSDDRTQHFAVSFGARFVQRPCQERSLAYGGDEGFHRTWGIHQISYKYPWLFVIDADERLTPESATELQAIANDPDSSHVAYRIRRRDFFQGRQLRFVQTSPWYIRFFRPEFVHYERLVNTITVVDGSVANLHHPLDHYPFSKGLSHWFARHNSYSTFEARQILKNRHCNEPFSLISAFFERDFNVRRYHQKELFYRLPARPFVKFFLLYILKCGFLDGRAGLTYAILQSVYEMLIVLKVQEMEAS